MSALQVFYETNYETRKNVARTIRINDATSNDIIAVLEKHKLIALCPIAKKGISYKITKKGADAYKKARDAYHNVGMKLD